MELRVSQTLLLVEHRELRRTRGRQQLQKLEEAKLCYSPFFVPLEYAGVFKDVREDNPDFVVDVLLKLLGREGRAVLL